jgi:hypothetical protein
MASTYNDDCPSCGVCCMYCSSTPCICVDMVEYNLRTKEIQEQFEQQRSNKQKGK